MATQGKNNNIIDGYEFVDLGLPSGTLWATMNIGASTIYDIGLYFRWGEVSGFAGGNTTTYKWNNNSKYNNTDKLTQLQLEDDAAHVNMGGRWVMPTEEQLKELANSSYTTKSNVSDYQGSGVSGYKYVSKINGKEIFFPYCGEYNGTTKYNGSKVYIWTSTRNPGTTTSTIKLAVTLNDTGTDVKHEQRSYFLTVRGVCNITI